MSRIERGIFKKCSSEVCNFLQGKRPPMASTFQVVTFRVGGQMYGADIFLLDEILPMMEFRKIPKGPDFLEGIINVRGEMIPLVDLRCCFGSGDAGPYRFETKILVARFNNRKVGFIVDHVLDVKNFDKEAVRPAPLDERQSAGIISGVAELDGGEIVQMLKLDKILDESSLGQIAKLEIENS